MKIFNPFDKVFQHKISQQNIFDEVFGHIAGARAFVYPKAQEGGAAPTAVTWDSDSTHANLTLSGGDLIVDHDGSASTRLQTFATAGKSSGKLYFEIKCDSLTNTTIGVGEVTPTLVGRIGDLSTGWGWQYNNRFYHSGAWAAATAGYTTGDIIQIAVDLTNGYLWFGKNNTWIGKSGDSPNPATGTDPTFTGLSGTLFPGLSLYADTNQHTGRFKLADFDYTPPTGFSAWES